jgi:hypothetical protein
MTILPKSYSHFFLYLLLSLVLFLSLFTPFVQAKAFPPAAQPPVTVSASIGEYYLSVSGYIAPFASIALIIDGIYYRGTVADANGNFSITNVRIKAGFTGFCLQAKDFHNLGESYSCFTVPPAKGSIRKDNIFLPPTLALQRTEIAAGSSVLAFGYTMPGATVRLHIAGRILTVKADQNGYFVVTISGLKAGEYQLYADATYNGHDSVSPSRFLKLKALGLWEQFIALLIQLWKWLVGLLIGTGIGLLWIGIPLIIFIFFLIGKIWPERFTTIYNSKLVMFFAGRKRKKLHHAWFVGY